MNLWLEVEQLASTITFSDEEDSLVWLFNSNGIYSTQFINFRGILLSPCGCCMGTEAPQPPHPAPTRVHFLLWLLSKNKVLTGDNLGIRREVEDKSCAMSWKTVNNLFFECTIAKQLWCHLSEIFDRELGLDFLSVGQLWISNKKFMVCNTFCAAAQWGLWKLRNNLRFQDMSWKDMNYLLLEIANILQSWRLSFPMERRQEFITRWKLLRSMATRPARIGG